MTFTCSFCAREYRSFNHGSRFCSRSCMAKSRVDHLRRISHLGAIAMAAKARLPKDPKPRKLQRLCVMCGSPVWCRKSYTCSKKCGYEWRKSKTPKHRTPNKTCRQCGRPYHAYEKHRMYCSYPCFLKSGGAFRAGTAAQKGRQMRGIAKKDNNHKEIVEQITARGVAFYDLSGYGNGVPDGIAWVNDQWRLVEIKNPKTGYGRRGMNHNQVSWLGQWQGGPVYILKSIENAVDFAEGRLDRVEVMTAAEAAVISAGYGNGRSDCKKSASGLARRKDL